MKVNLELKYIMNAKVIDNYSKLKLSLFLLPLFILSVIVLFLFSQNALSVVKYIAVQKDCFYFINSQYSQFPTIIYNLTQMGDALVFLSLLSILILYVPKLWESLISASLVSAIFSIVLKNFFAVPRPAAMFDNDSFAIIGQTLCGHNSLPSGHSITIFTVLTVLLFAFMSNNLKYNIVWSILIISTGLILVFNRVGSGAHYPLDVITGSSIGFISGLAGIFISRKYKIWSWIDNNKYYPVFIVLFMICCIAIINKIIDTNLVIYYFTLISLITSIYQITYAYIKK